MIQVLFVKVGDWVGVKVLCSFQDWDLSLIWILSGQGLFLFFIFFFFLPSLFYLSSLPPPSLSSGDGSKWDANSTTVCVKYYLMAPLDYWTHFGQKFKISISAWNTWLSHIFRGRFEPAWMQQGDTTLLEFCHGNCRDKCSLTLCLLSARNETLYYLNWTVTTGWKYLNIIWQYRLAGRHVMLTRPCKIWPCFMMLKMAFLRWKHLIFF